MLFCPKCKTIMYPDGDKLNAKDVGIAKAKENHKLLVEKEKKKKWL